MIVLCVGGGIGLKAYNDHNKRTPEDKGENFRISQQEYGKRTVAELKAAPPANNASPEQKASYFATIIGFEYDAGDYKAVTKSYEEFISQFAAIDIKTDQPHTTAAAAYVKLGNTKAALEALDRAKLVDEKIPNADDRADALRAVQQTKEGITK